MRFRQAYRVVLGAFLLAGAAAQAEDRSANQVLLAPGKSITFSDAANPGINVVVTAPGDAYVNLSRLVAASEKAGIYSIMTTVQIRAASTIVSNADGSLSLRPASSQSYFVPKEAAPVPGRITLEGGTALLDRGRVVIHSDRIIQPTGVTPAPAKPLLHASPVVPAAPQAITRPAAAVVAMPSNVAIPASGHAIQASVPSTATVNFSGFNISAGSGVTVMQAPGGVTLNSVSGGNINITGNMSAVGNVVIINPGGTVTVGPNVVAPSGGLTISTQPTVPMTTPSFGTLTTTGGIKPPTPVILTPR